MTPKNGKGNLPNLQQAQAAKRVTLAEWRAGRLHELELPSGLAVKVRDVSMTDLLFTGKLPDSILAMMQEQADGGASEIDLSTITKNTQDFNAMMDAMVELCMVEPKIGAVADDDHILLSELPFDDKMAVFNFLNRGADQLRSFREGENKPVEAV